MGYISWVSPLARALLGKQVGDVVKVVAPAGEDQYEIIDVQYQSPKP
jgi:transcription elongation factor GreB